MSVHTESTISPDVSSSCASVLRKRPVSSGLKRRRYSGCAADTFQSERDRHPLRNRTVFSTPPLRRGTEASMRGVAVQIAQHLQHPHRHVGEVRCWPPCAASRTRCSAGCLASIRLIHSVHIAQRGAPAAGRRSGLPTHHSCPGLSPSWAPVISSRQRFAARPPSGKPKWTRLGSPLQRTDPAGPSSLTHYPRLRRVAAGVAGSRTGPS